jgi:hypothetical protein
MGLLERARHIAHLELGPDIVLEPDFPEAAVDLVWRVLGPELLDGLDRLDDHLGPQLRLAHVEHLDVAHEAAGADAHDEAPAAEVVEHGDVRGDRGGMHLRQVDDAGAERDLGGPRNQGREEDERRGDALAPRAEVLAHERLGEPEAVGEHDGLLVLLEDLPVVPVGMMKGHGEQAELDAHERSPITGKPGSDPRPAR